MQINRKFSICEHRNKKTTIDLTGRIFGSHALVHRDSITEKVFGFHSLNSVNSALQILGGSVNATRNSEIINNSVIIPVNGDDGDRTRQMSTNLKEDNANILNQEDALKPSEEPVIMEILEESNVENQSENSEIIANSVIFGVNDDDSIKYANDDSIKCVNDDGTYQMLTNLKEDNACMQNQEDALKHSEGPAILDILQEFNAQNQSEYILKEALVYISEDDKYACIARTDSTKIHKSKISVPSDRVYNLRPTVQRVLSNEGKPVYVHMENKYDDLDREELKKTGPENGKQLSRRSGEKAASNKTEGKMTNKSAQKSPATKDSGKKRRKVDS